MTAVVEVRDNSIWFRHIRGDASLVARLEALRSGETILLEIDGVTGPWQRMRSGADGRPTNGLQALGSAAEFWMRTQARRGDWLPICIAPQVATNEIAPPPINSQSELAEPVTIPVRSAQEIRPLGHVAALPPDTRLNQFIVDSVLGSGGFGITYRAVEQFTDRYVAIKEYMPSSIAGRDPSSRAVRPLRSGDSEDFRWGLGRFREEAKVLVRLRHISVVHVLTYFEANDTGYLVMEYHEGISLGEKLKWNLSLSEDELLEIVEPLISGIEEVHLRGFLHRDIKPDNILIRKDGIPVLLDFGSARQALVQHSQGLTAVVTLGYAPPEQYERNAKQGPWTDIYALGALMYHCILGEKPAPANERLWALHHRNSDPLDASVERLRRVASSKIVNAILRSLQLKSEDRPQSIAEFATLLPPASAETLLLGERPRERSAAEPLPVPHRDQSPIRASRPALNVVASMFVSTITCADSVIGNGIRHSHKLNVSWVSPCLQVRAATMPGGRIQHRAPGTPTRWRGPLPVGKRRG